MASRALALRQSEWRNCGLCVCLYVKSGAKLLVGIYRNEKGKNKLFE